MVMTNAIFFDGVWRKPFAEETSFEFTFYRTPHEEIRTTYMTQQGNFYFFESKKMNAKIIRLPYKVNILQRENNFKDKISFYFDAIGKKILHDYNFARC